LSQREAMSRVLRIIIGFWWPIALRNPRH
jgi:hypothetical protein